jgi:hypothetical protein
MVNQLVATAVPSSVLGQEIALALPTQALKLSLLRTNRISHDRSPRAQRLLRADRRISRSLMFDLGI